MKDKPKKYHSLKQVVKDYPRTEGLNAVFVNWCIRRDGFYQDDESHKKLYREHLSEIVSEYTQTIEQAHKQAAKSKLTFKELRKQNWEYYKRVDAFLKWSQEHSKQEKRLVGHLEKSVA